MGLTTEIVVYNIESAINAQRGGADRVELCDNSGDGGTTPSFGTIQVVRDALDISLFVMIRPRGGDFCYSGLEFEAMKHDINQCKKLGTDGVVFGILCPDGSIDEQRCKELIDLARPLKVTCHRAFDMTRDPISALQSCIDVGFDRILTSGQKAKALKGSPLIKKLVQKAKQQISIMAGCGVDEETVAEILKETGVHEIHLSAEAKRASVMQFENSAIAGMGSSKGEEYNLTVASAERIQTIRKKALAVRSTYVE